MAKSTDFDQIVTDIKGGTVAPVYLLHGEEAYYIDEITRLLLEHVVDEDARDFNLTQFYGSDINRLGSLTEVITACRRYPMMAERQLVTLREIQTFDARAVRIDDLELYLEHPLQSTVLLITQKGKPFDARKKVYKLCAQHGVVFESRRYRDYELPKVVRRHLEQDGYRIDDRALGALCESVGSDLSRIMSEVAKLEISTGNKMITFAQVSAQIGISKEFNNWELQSAIARRDVARVEQIRQYFERNPKQNPAVVTLSVLFGFFTSVMLSFYAQDKTERGLMSEIGLSFPAAKDVLAAKRWCNAWKAMSNIALIRDYDARMKGARSVPGGCDAELLKELLFKLMH